MSQFPIKVRGDYREQLLETYRWGLRRRTNPETGQTFTEDEIARLCGERGTAWLRAEAIDILCMLDQQRGKWLLAQLDPRTAATSVLEALWSVLWDLPYLAASGGNGTVSAPAPAGTTFTGSPVLGDPTAVWGVVQGGPAVGLKFQVLFTVESPLNGDDATLTVAGLDAGYVTNLDIGTKIKWSNAPDIVTELGTVATKFTGGNPRESDQEYADRLMRRIRHKPAASNSSHVQSWAEDASTNAIAIAFVWACALHAGTTVVTVVQKRGNIQGPTGRIPGAGTLAIATARLVSPGSPVFPTPPMVWVVDINPVAADLVIDLSMPKGSTAGWADVQPWPSETGGVGPFVQTVTNQTHFRMASAVDLPSGVTQPAMMIWNATTSRFEQLQVLSVTPAGGALFDVVLSAAPATTITATALISPWTEKAPLIGPAIEAYFDSLGPGELVASTDARWHRAFRFPQPTESFPQRAGASVTGYIGDALGGSLADAVLASISVTSPPLPVDVRDGPSLIVAGKVAVSSF